ncbi:hypothetical protein [Epilithonimonas sp.]|uniref:hypothetical protein n=1 Tax=Epilithonimonas sp. TaxID=2894511 RepID=UPI0035B08C3A
MENTEQKISEEITSQEKLFSINWEDIENENLDYDFSMEELEIFFREDLDNAIIY